MRNEIRRVDDEVLTWLLEITSEAISVRRVDDLRLVRANQAYVELVGVPLEELLGTTPADLRAAGTEVHRRWIATVAEEGIHDVESDVRLPGGVRRLHVTSRIVDLGGSRCTLSVHRDLTDREQAGFSPAEERFRALVEQIPAVVYIDAVEGPETTIYISPQSEAILGFAQRDWMADPNLMSKHVHPEDRSRWRASTEQAEATGEPIPVEYRIIRPDGSVIWVHDQAVLIRGQNGAPSVWQGVMFDVTDRKAAEDALREALDRERLAVERLRALDEMKNTFLQAVSHELRTPLTAILGSALTLEREDVAVTEQESRDLVGGIATNARKLHRLLADLLDLDRLSRGILEPNRRPTDVGALIRRVLEEPGLLAGRPVTVDADVVVAELDAPKVDRIVENLLVNAARHTPAGAPVWVRVRGQADGVLIAVEDAGPGIPADQRASVFEPFRQLGGGPPGSHAPGVGVGLSLVARFAELHGGRAWVQERPGGGASFRVFLPGPAHGADFAVGATSEQ